jgi:hypothetical protein
MLGSASSFSSLLGFATLPLEAGHCSRSARFLLGRSRSSKLAAAFSRGAAPDASVLSQSVNGKFPNVDNLTEAERFAAAVADVPETVAKFFEAEDPVRSWRRESDQARIEREGLASFGGWCG